MEIVSKQLNAKTIVKRIVFGTLLIALLVGLTLIAVWLWRDKNDFDNLCAFFVFGWIMGLFTFLLIIIPEKIIHLLFKILEKCSKKSKDGTFQDWAASEDLAYKKRYISVIFTFVFSILMFAIAIIMGIF